MKRGEREAQVHAALRRAGKPLSAYSLLDGLRDKGFRAPLQVYRALEKLIAAGEVHRLESLNAFVACRHKTCANHGAAMFAICNDCGYVSEFADAELANRVRNSAETSGFALERTTIELHGLCRDCSKKVNETTP